MSRFGIMKHLAVLEKAGLVLVRRQGRERWNHLNAVPLQQIYERWMSPYQAVWASALLGRKRGIEGQRTKEELATKTSEKNLGTMHIEQEIVIEAPPAKVFAAMTRDVAAWWGAPYLVKDTATDIVLEPRLGGRFYEVWGDNEGAMWATVTAFQRDARLDLTGPIGMGGAVAGVVSFVLEPRGKGTLLKLSHRAAGELSDEAETRYTKGWADLLGTRLKAFVESGKKSGLAGKR